MTNITCEQLYNLWISEPDLVRILDLRSRHEFEHAHIPGSLSIAPDQLCEAMGQLDGRLAVLIAPEEAKANIAELLLAREDYVFLNECQAWQSGNMPLAGSSIQKILESCQSSRTSRVILKQFFDFGSLGLSYILADQSSRETAIIDPVEEQLDQYLKVIKEMELRVMFVLRTHHHANEGARDLRLCQRIGARLAVANEAPVPGADILLEDGQELLLGDSKIRVIATPGHTPSSVSYYFESMVFTGDTLLYRNCGRPHPAAGATEKLYESIQNRLFSLPDETIVLPAHDANRQLSSTIGMEKKYNQALPENRTLLEFMNYINGITQ